MGHHGDGYLLAVPKKNHDRYGRTARKAGILWIEHGAPQFVGTVAEDVSPGEPTSFPQAAKLKRAETVVCYRIAHHTRVDRDNVNAKVVADSRISSRSKNKSVPFDGKRMIRGSVKTIVTPEPEKS